MSRILLPLLLLVSLNGLLRRGAESFERRDFPRSAAAFQQSLDVALALGHQPGEAQARLGLGKVFNAQGDFPRARTHLTRARDLLREQPDRARASNDLAYTEWASGNSAAATALYEEALAAFRAAGIQPEVAKVLYNLAFMTRPGSTRLARIEEAVNAARETANTRLAGKGTHLWGDTLYMLGDLRGALEKLNLALPMLDQPEDRGDRARVLVSLGRVYATHFRHDIALGYFEKALAIHRELGEKQAVVQALNSIATSHRYLGDLSRATASGEEALVLARQTGSPSVLAGTLASHALLLMARHQDREALAMSLEAARVHPGGAGREYLSIADVQLRLGQQTEALDAAGTALARARKANDLSFTARAHFWRARALDAAGRGPEALADLRTSLAITEKLRAQTGPTDFLKRGYAETWDRLVAYSVDLFFRQNLPEEALVAAEQGRARAFLDLLATRSVQDSVEHPPATAAAPEPHISSSAAVPPPTIAGIRRLADSTGSTVLAYWVAGDSTFIWVVPAAGPLTAVRVPVGAARLDDLVGRVARAAPQPLLAQVRTRGGAAIPTTAQTLDPYREMYRLLIEPVAKHLPGPSSALTIVPHGPLHRLSFAALRGAGGRYLLEDYVIGYLPSTSALDQLSGPARGGNYLFVADPRVLPPGPEGQTLPALPGALRESAVGALALRGSKVSVLSGAAATEPAVRDRLAGPRVLHFATHGLLLDQKPFDSFLALGRGAGTPLDDGRLTVREIYDLKLQADLVVLSACRTAAGPVTGDGLNSMTRAFFYAGARGVMATLWDVADEPTERLASRFYTYYAQGRPAAASLRAAQLDLLSALRKGQVRLSTSLGAVVLNENPLFWAGFVMLGRS